MTGFKADKRNTKHGGGERIRSRTRKNGHLMMRGGGDLRGRRKQHKIRKYCRMKVKKYVSPKSFP